jgi:O-antigen ligase
MRSETASKNMIDQIAFGAFLLLVASLAIQKPAVTTFEGQSIAATDLAFPFAALLATLTFFVGERRLIFDRVLIFLGFYASAFVVATVFSPNVSRSTLKTLATLYLVGVAGLTAYLVDSRSRLKIAVLTFLGASAIPIFIGIVTILVFYISPGSPLLSYVTSHYGAVPVGNYPRLSSTFVSASMFCNYLNVVLMLFLFAFTKDWIRKWLFVVGLAAVAVCALFTISIGLGAIVLAAGIWFWCRHDKTLPGRAALILGVSICVLWLVASFVALQPHSTAPYSFQLPVTGTTVYPSPRLLIWTEAAQNFVNNFLVGSGPASRSAAVMFQNSDGTFSLLTDAHNSYLSIATQTGVIGLLALLTLTIYLLQIGFTRIQHSPVRLGLAVTFLTAFVVQGLTGSFEDARHLWFLIGILAASNTIEKKGSSTEVRSST